ncbi:hypothetical protein KC939_00400 [Candidatus Saccharibacteria bacterium]|nr:hypothetical protein [Candidatus Saccharibacteria bacterium]
MASKTAKNKTKKKVVAPKHLSMHALLDSLSFSGTVGRTLFVTFLALICFILVILHVQTEPGGDSSLIGGGLLYLSLAVIGFALFDAAYVWLQHLHSLPVLLDRIVLFVVELGAVALFIMPFIIEMSLNQLYVNVWLPLGMALLLLMRYVTGVLFSKE